MQRVIDKVKLLEVILGERSYPIFIGVDVVKAEALTPCINGNQVMVVTNETVAPLYLAKLRSTLSGFSVDSVVLPDGERFKTIDTVNSIFDRLLSKRHGRTSTVIALGGGVVGDMAGFAAACYQRGVDFVQVPTTLLAQVDSSVGGKTGVNHPLGKNMIGAFHQPNAVFIDIDTLTTLPARELSAGIAEIIKYGLIRDPAFLQYIDEELENLLTLDTKTLEKIIYRSCEIKAEVVASDEREQGVRAILNLGHTFGHAIEAYTEYKSWLHGEAVAVGMLMAADLSLRHQYITPAEYDTLTLLLTRASLPVRPPDNMKPSDFMRYMAVDKKVVDNSIRLVLLKGIGNAMVSSDYNALLLWDTLRSFTEGL